MRLLDMFAMGLACIAALCPVTLLSRPLDDARHQRREQAARVLRNALREASDRAWTRQQRLDLYASACSEASEILGLASHAAQELAGAIQAATAAGSDDEARELVLRAAIEEVAGRLAFRPIIEAELPRGFPPPTPVGEIELKQLPAYRMAEAPSAGGEAFWTLFQHIKKEGIAMTAPVQMGYQGAGQAEVSQRSMAFLYGDPQQGKLIPEGQVTVIDVPPSTVLSVGVRGDRTPEKVLSARRRIMDWLRDNSTRYEAAGEIRVMGYNSPFVPVDRRYIEVQIPVRERAGKNSSYGLPPRGDRAPLSRRRG